MNRRKLFFYRSMDLRSKGKWRDLARQCLLWIVFFSFCSHPLFADKAINQALRNAIRQTRVFDGGNLADPLAPEEAEAGDEVLHPLNLETEPLWKEDFVPRTQLSQIVENEQTVARLREYASRILEEGKDPRKICIYVVQNGLTWTAFAKGMVNEALRAGFTVVPVRYGSDTPDRSLEKALEVIRNTDDATLLARYYHVRREANGDRESAAKEFISWFRGGLVEEFQKEIWKRRGKEFVDVFVTYLSKEDGLRSPIKRKQLIKALFIASLASVIYFATNQVKYHDGIPAEKSLWWALAFRGVTTFIFQAVNRAHNRLITRMEWRPKQKALDVEPVRYYAFSFFRSAPFTAINQMIFHGPTGTFVNVVLDPVWNSFVGLPTKFYRQFISKRQKGIAADPKAKVDSDDSIDTKVVTTEAAYTVLRDGALIGLDQWIDLHAMFNWLAAGGIGYELKKRYIPKFASRAKSWGYRFVRQTQKDLKLVGSALRLNGPVHQCTLLLVGDLPEDLSKAITLKGLSEADEGEVLEADDPDTLPDPEDPISNPLPPRDEG